MAVLIRQPENQALQLWLASIHFAGMLWFGAMAITSAAAIAHHLERAGLIDVSTKRRQLTAADEAWLREVTL